MAPFIPAAVVASSVYLSGSQLETRNLSRPSILENDFHNTSWILNVNELPVELLISIFETVHADTSPSTRAPTLMTMSHVCRRWRQAALECEWPWTYLPLASAAWTKECLSRCASAPLEINARDKVWRAWNSAKLVELVANVLPRTKSLHFCIPEDSATSAELLPDVLHMLNSHQAPLLEELLLSFRRYDDDGYFARAARLVEPLFLDLSLRSLRKAVFVDAVMFLEDMTPFSNIRSLELMNSMIWRNTQELQAFCRAFSLLEELVFIYDQGAASPRQFRVDMSINEDASAQAARCLPMRHMKRLVYHATPFQVARSFSLLELPSTSSIMLTYDAYRWSEGPVTAVLGDVLANLGLGGQGGQVPDALANAPAIEPINSALAWPTLKTAMCVHFAGVEDQRFSSVMLDGRELHASTIDTDEASDLPSTFIITIPFLGYRSTEHMLCNLPVFLETPSLIIKPPRNLHNTDNLPQFTIEEIHDIFHLFSGISELTLYGDTLLRFIERYKSVGPRPAFPNLESLRICDVDLAQGVDDPEKPRVVMNDLICALFRPGRVSEWLEYLVLERCTINEADVALLRQGVEAELKIEGAELELIECTIVTDEMFAKDYTEDE